MQEGTSPSTPHFIHTCAMLCASSDKARCLVSFELRSSLVKSTFLEEAAKAFNKVLPDAQFVGHASCMLAE